MVDKNYYLFKDLLIVLREEYLKNKEELNLLQSFVVANNEKIDEYCFSISNENLIIKYKRQKSILESFKRKLEYISGIERYIMFSKGQDRCEISQKFFSNFSINNMSLFLQQVDKISNSDFMKHMNLDRHYFENSLYIDLSINHNYINLINEFNGDLIMYNAQRDNVFLNVKNRRYLEDSVYKLFYQKIPADILSDYHLSILKKDSINSQIILPNELYNNEYYSISYDKSKLILKKIKATIH